MRYRVPCILPFRAFAIKFPKQHVKDLYSGYFDLYFSQVVDIETGAELGPGEHGELCFRGPQVMVGYLNKPEANAFTLRDGWIYTGTF